MESIRAAGRSTSSNAITTRQQRNYFWPGMFREIARYVRECPSCLSHKAAQTIRYPPSDRDQPLLAAGIRRPRRPLPRSSSGNMWLLNMQDHFSKWVEMRLLRRVTEYSMASYRRGDTTPRISRRNFIRQRDLIHIDRTDQRPARTRNLARFTPTYTSQCNPVERANRTVKTMIAQYVGRRHRSWNERLPELQFIVNTAPHDATEYSPAYLNHGREFRQPTEPSRRGLAIPPSKLRRRLEKAFEIVRINLARAFQRQERYYNFHHREWRPRIDE